MLRLIIPREAYLASYAEAFGEYEGYPRRAGNPFSNPRNGDLLVHLDDMRHARNLPEGWVGYAVRLGEWNKGYGTLMLAFALPYAKELGITRCLITCDDDNPGSARVMEKNGFVLGDRIPNTIDGQEIITRRYWKTL